MQNQQNLIRGKVSQNLITSRNMELWSLPYYETIVEKKEKKTTLPTSTLYAANV